MSQTVPDLERMLAAYRTAPGSRLFAPLADAYRESGRVAEAVELLQQGVAAHPGYVSALVLLAQCLLELGRDAEAEDRFARVVELDPENLAAMKYRAARAVRRGDASRARFLLDALLEIDPWDRDARAARAELERAATAAPASASNASWLVEPEPAAPPPAGADEATFPLAPELPADAEADIPIVDLEPIGGVLEPQGDEPAAAAEAAPAAPEVVPEGFPPPPAAGGMAADWEVERQDDRIVVRQRPSLEMKRPDVEPGRAERAAAVRRGADEFSTLTLARIYESQGYLDRALAIYDELHRRHPENTDVADRLRALQRRLAGVDTAAATAPSPAPPPPPWRLLDAAALGDAPQDAAQALQRLTDAARDRDLARRHTFIGTPPDAGAVSTEAVPPLASAAEREPEREPEPEPDFERFLRYVRSLKR